MSRKIRFPLEMKNRIMVRTLEELKNNFDFEKLIIHYKTGKLLIWLEDRYYDDEAEKLKEISQEDIDFNKKLCNIFKVEYNKEFEIDIEELERKNLKLSKLKQFTDDEKIIKNIDRVAFNQEELFDLLDKREKIVYICGNEFNVPIEIEDITYIGINNVIANIKLEDISILEEKKIKFIDTVVKNNGKIVELYKQNKGAWEVFSRKEYIFDPNIEYSYENKDGKIYNLEIISLLARDKNTSEEIKITQNKESVYKYITYENKIFYIVGKYKKRQVFMRILGDNDNIYLGECKREFEDFVCVDNEFVIWKDIDSNYYSINYNNNTHKEIYNPRYHRNSLIYDEVFINKYFIFIDRDNFLYSKNVITNELKFIFDKVKVLKKYNDTIYIVKTANDTYETENFYKVNINTNECEFISSTKQMRHGSVVNIEFYENNIIWVNSGLYRFTLNIINLETRVLKELDEWRGCGSIGLSSLKVKDGYIYYNNLSVTCTYDRINRRVKLDGSYKEEVKNL